MIGSVVIARRPIVRCCRTTNLQNVSDDSASTPSQRRTCVAVSTSNRNRSDGSEGKKPVKPSNPRFWWAAISVLCCAAAVSFSVASRERDWRHAHPYQLGPSGYIVALGIVGVCLSLVAGWLLYTVREVGRDAEQIRRSLYERLARLEAETAKGSADPERISGA